ncbi:MAG: transglycosylase SLT domain-containing protein [Nitrospinota bacterium]
MQKAIIIFLSFFFTILISGSVFSEIENEEEIIEQTDSSLSLSLSLSDEEINSPEVSTEEDETLFEELSSPDANLFHVPPNLRANVDFWKKIYTEYTTNQMVIHDSNNLNVIYAVVDLSNGLRIGNKIKKWKISEVRKKYRNILISIHYKIKKGRMLNDEEIEVYKKFDNIDKPNKFLAAAENIRGQLGQRDRFIEGLKRSGRYMDRIKEVFKDYGLPEELTVLPHVESSFNYRAYSSAGASGIWQFTRSTGRLFMQIDYAVDERNDPIISTDAAARLLKRNYEELGSWPLAITAYNHGLAGMKRAKERIGDDVTDVINGYRSRIFGFASKNFFCEFLAALEIVSDYRKYFGEVEFEKPVEYDVFEVESYLDVGTLSKHMGLARDEIKELNPALRLPIFTSRRYIPKGFELKIPKGKLQDAGNIYASLPKDVKNQSQKHSPWHQVEKGDTMGKIARTYNTTIAAIMEINEIDNVNRIYGGQILKLPESVSIQGKTKNIYQNTINVALESAVEETKPKPIVQQDNEDKSVNSEFRKTDSTGTSPAFLKAVYEVTVPANYDSKKINYGFIKVELDETIGHYADWSGASVQSLKDMNSLRRRIGLKIGQKLKIPFTSVTKESFEEKRAEHHMAIQEDFFSNYKVEGTTSHKIKTGETVWKLCAESEIPFWLLKRYNPDKDLQRLAKGEPLILPIISNIN